MQDETNGESSCVATIPPTLRWPRWAIDKLALDLALVLPGVPEVLFGVQFLEADDT